MKIRKLLILAVIPLVSLTVQAQCDKPKGPHKGDITLAATVSYNNTTTQKALPGNLTDYSISAVSTNWNDKALQVGIEGGWFFSDQWKLTVGGGMSITSNPGYSAVPGTIDEDSEAGDGSIPNYKAVASQSDIQFNVFAGVDRYFRSHVPGLLPYVGLRLGYAYGRNSAFADEEDSMGKSIGESFNIRGAATFGVDYYLTPSLFLGVQVDPLAYTYNRTTVVPQAGLGSLAANSNNVSILAAPTIKLGFKF